jgi:hypothetical protein
MSLANYVAIGALAGVGLAVILKLASMENENRAVLAQRSARLEDDVYEQQENPLATLTELIESGELHPDAVVLTGKLPGTYGSTRYMYRVKSTGRVFYSYSPIQIVGNTRTN